MRTDAEEKKRRERRNAVKREKRKERAGKVKKVAKPKKKPAKLASGIKLVDAPRVDLSEGHWPKEETKEGDMPAPPGYPLDLITRPLPPAPLPDPDAFPFPVDCWVSFRRGRGTSTGQVRRLLGSPRTTHLRVKRGKPYFDTVSVLVANGGLMRVDAPKEEEEG